MSVLSRTIIIVAIIYTVYMLVMAHQNAAQNASRNIPFTGKAPPGVDFTDIGDRRATLQDEEHQRSFARLMIVEKRPDMAETCLTQAIRTYPHYTPLYDDLEHLYIQEGRKADAARVLRDRAKHTGLQH